jgi:hypothetical protein
MRTGLALITALLLGGCAHSEVAVNSGSRSVTTNAGVQVNASGRVAAVLAAGMLIAVGLSEPSEPAPRYRSLADWFANEPVPEMDPSRSVSEQDCSKPIVGSGNLKCR